MGFEPTTPGLKVRSSTTELRALPDKFVCILTPAHTASRSSQARNNNAVRESFTAG